VSAEAETLGDDNERAGIRNSARPNQIHPVDKEYPEPTEAVSARCSPFSLWGRELGFQGRLTLESHADQERGGGGVRTYTWRAAGGLRRTLSRVA